MKFLTKSWYRQMSQKSHLHLSLQTDRRAAEYSEAFYQDLYARRLAERLEVMKRVCALGKTPFQENQETAQFAQGHQWRMEHLRQVLPQEILDQVADLRVLALDTATADVKGAVTRWCQENRRQSEEIFQTYLDDSKQARPLVGEALQKRFSFHDNTVTRVERAPDRLTLYLGDDGYSSVGRVDFLSPVILEEDPGLEGAIWLYQEIHPAQGGNEYHALLCQEDDRLLYFTVFAKGLRLFEGESPWETPSFCLPEP